LPDEEDRDAAPAPIDAADKALTNARLITVAEFAELARLSRRQIDRLRKRRPPGFPPSTNLGSGSGNPRRRAPRFKLTEVENWIGTRAAW